VSSVARWLNLVHAGRTPEELAHEFEPTAQSIRNWVAQWERNAYSLTDRRLPRADRRGGYRRLAPI
jgi:transposase-like protein